MGNTSILFFTDIHYRGNNPVSRKDDYPRAILNKVGQIIDLAHIYKVDALVDGGDTFDSVSPANSVIYELAEVYVKASVPLYKILGSHETVGYNYSLDTRKRTASGILDISEVVSILDKPVVIEGGGVPILLGGVHHQFSQYETNDFDPFGDVDIGDCFPIAAVHGMLTREPFMGPHVLVEDALVGPSRLVLSGHNHTPFRCIRSDGVEFINPGAVARVDNTEKERQRTPKVVLISVDGGGEVTVKLIKLNVSQGVFYDRELEVSVDDNMEAMFQKLSEMVAGVEFHSIRDVVLGLCDKSGVTDNQKELAITILEESDNG